MPNTKPVKIYAWSGFSLIEVMVAMVIFSVGLLGLAGMQITGMRTVRNTTDYTMASLAANDLAERMRANPVALAAGTFRTYDFSTVNCTVLPAPYCRGAAVSCNPEELALYELFTWYCGDTADTGIGDTLALTNLAFPVKPGDPNSIITCIDINPASGDDGDPCTPGSPYEVNLTWIELNQDQDETNPKPEQTVYLRVLP